MFSIVLCLCLSFTTANTYAQMPNRETTQNIETRTGEEAVFKDVSTKDWYYDAAMFVNSRGFMTGMSPGIFGGSTKLSRAQFATILHRMAGTEKVPYEKKFKDVPQGTFFTDAVMWASSKGIITGYTEGPTKGYFGASDYITREQMAVMMYRYADSLGIDVSGRSDLNTFKDGKKTSPFAKDQMAWAVSYGLISGNDNGTLAPQGTAARAECAMIIMRYTLKNEESGGITREDWIVSLIDVLEKDTTSVIDEYSFNEADEVDSPEVIETAYRWGMIPGFDGSSKMNFSPDTPATREFIAYTAIHGLGYTLEETELQFSDSAQCTYLLEDEYAVSLGLLKENDGAFVPGGTVNKTEKEDILAKIKELTGTGEETEVIDYADDVKESTMDYDLNEQSQQITTTDTEAKNWKPGEIHVLINEENPEDSIAIKVENVTSSGGQINISYSTPEFGEVIDEIDMSGSVSQEGTFIPDPEINIENMPMTRANGSGEIPLSKEISFSKKVNMQGENIELIKGTLSIDSIDYNFDIDGGFPLPDINRAYIAVNNSATVSSNINIEDLVGDDLKYEFTLGTIMVPIGPIFIEGNINAVIDLDGNFTLKYEITNKTGIDYSQGKFKPVFTIKQDLKDLSLEGSLKAGFEMEPAVSFLGFDIASVGAEFGRNFEGKAQIYELNPFKFCLDTDTYLYASISAKMLNGWKEYDVDILTKEEGLGRDYYHFEETGNTGTCTRTKGYYKGKVLSLADSSPIEGATIKVVKQDKTIDSVMTNNNGEFVGSKIEIGDYTLIVEKEGYYTYQQEITINTESSLYIPTIYLNKKSESGSSEEDFVINEFGDLTEYKGPGGHIVIPDGVITIVAKVFYNDKTISSVEFPDSLEEIGANAFAGTNLKGDIVLPKNFKKLYSGCFVDANLDRLVIPKDFKYQHDYHYAYPFSGATINKVVFEEGRTETDTYLFSYCDIGEIEFPTTLEVINGLSFDHNSALKKLDFTECTNLKKIDTAFYECSALEVVILPEEVEELDGCFSNCVNLKTITLPKSFTYASLPFNNCSNIENVIFREGITVIPHLLLYRLSSVKELHIPKSVTMIDDTVFYGWTSIEKIYIPESVTTIVDDAGIRQINPEIDLGYRPTIVCKEGSYAHEWAEELNCPIIFDDSMGTD